MALVEGCKHTLEITVPLEEVQKETDRVVNDFRAKVRLPGFRPGKAPVSIVRQRFPQEIRQEVLESILPKFFRRTADEEKLAVVGTPNVTEIHFHDNEPLRFKAEFEVAPEITLNEYKGLEVPYAEPVVSDEDVNSRLEQLRERRAEYINEDPRPLQDGDYAAISLKSIAGSDEPIESDDLSIQLSGSETVQGFTENLRNMSPGEEKEFDVYYPEDFGSDKLAGKTVRFHAKVNAVRRKELPELNDEFAKDLGDFQTIDELKDALRRQIASERTYEAQGQAKNAVVEKLIDSHEFPVPQAYVDQQIKNIVESRLRSLAENGVDPSKLKLDWDKVRESHKERAMREVKGSLLLEKVADVEDIQVSNEEVDQEVQRFAKQEREPVAAARLRLEKSGVLPQIAARIRTEKVLQFLFDQANKVAPVEVAPAEAAPAEPAPAE